MICTECGAEDFFVEAGDGSLVCLNCGSQDTGTFDEDGNEDYPRQSEEQKYYDAHMRT